MIIIEIRLQLWYMEVSPMVKTSSLDLHFSCVTSAGQSCCMEACDWADGGSGQVLPRLVVKKKSFNKPIPTNPSHHWKGLVSSNCIIQFPRHQHQGMSRHVKVQHVTRVPFGVFLWKSETSICDAEGPIKKSWYLAVYFFEKNMADKNNSSIL